MLNRNSSNGNAPDIELNNKKIDWVLKRIEGGEIKIPAFQRGFVWQQDQIIELLESIAKQYPIGSILLWESSERVQSSRNIAGYVLPERGEHFPVKYVLDGQQRLSSIYGVLSDGHRREDGDDRYSPQSGIFEISYNFKKEKFMPLDEISEADQRTSSLLLRNLLSQQYTQAYIALSKKYQSDAERLRFLFNNYEIPIVEITNRAREDVGVIFERINSTGTRLRVIDLMSAWTWTNGFNLLNHIEEISVKLEDSGFGALKDKTILQIIGGIIIGSTKTEKILKIDAENIRDNWAEILYAMDKTIDFIRNEFNCLSIDFLPHAQQLVVLSRFFATRKQIGAKQMKILKKYFWCTAFSDRYSTGRTTEKMDEEIELMDKLLNHDYSAFDKHDFTVNAAQLLSANLSMANPLTRSVLLLLAQYSPRSLVSGGAIALDAPLSSYNKKELHHVFPNQFLKDGGVEELAVRNSVLNFCFLPSAENKRISDKAPSDYFFNMVPASDYDSILESNLLPNDESIYRNNDYDKFRRERAALILDKIDDLTG